MRRRLVRQLIRIDWVRTCCSLPVACPCLRRAGMPDWSLRLERQAGAPDWISWGLRERRVGIAHGSAWRHARAVETGETGRSQSARGQAPRGTLQTYQVRGGSPAEEGGLRTGARRTAGGQQMGNGRDRGTVASQGADALGKPCRPSAGKSESRKLLMHAGSVAVPALRAGWRCAAQQSCRRRSAFCSITQDGMHAGSRILLCLSCREAFCGSRQKCVEIFRHAS